MSIEFKFRKEMPTLSLREQQILSRISRGDRNKTIAVELGIKEQTVKNECSGLYRKLNVSNRVGAAVMYLKHKI